VVIDERVPQQRPDIFAIGECAAVERQHVRPGGAGLRHGPRGRAALSAGQEQVAFAGADMSTKLKLMGVDVASIGDAQGRTPGCAQLPLHR
jgi:nitrite reductase (NADH) large subunit